MLLNTICTLIALAIIGYILFTIKAIRKEDTPVKLIRSDGAIVSARNNREAMLLTGITVSQIRCMRSFDAAWPDLKIHVAAPASLLSFSIL